MPLRSSDPTFRWLAWSILLFFVVLMFYGAWQLWSAGLELDGLHEQYQGIQRDNRAIDRRMDRQQKKREEPSERPD